jgi:outer membrane protein OmpA-like peptidoglycan-associated protein
MRFAMPKFQHPTLLVARIALVAALAGAAAPWAAAQMPSEACAPLWAKLQADIEVGDLESAAEAAKAVRGTSDCGELRVKANQAMFGAYREEAERLARDKAPPAVQLAALVAANGYGKLAWDLQAKVGDLKAQVQDFVGASQAYDRAVGLIYDLPANDRPQPDAVRRLDGLAFQFEQLSTNPVPRKEGLVRFLRQVEPTPTAAVSVQFHYDSHQMTDAGRAQAESLFKLLREERGMPRIHLVGHTDPKGSHDYNDDLSRRRASAVKDFLTAKGYPPGNITAEGRGKRDMDKLRIYDRTKFTEDQVHQMLRRVALDLRPTQ